MEHDFGNSDNSPDWTTHRQENDVPLTPPITKTPCPVNGGMDTPANYEIEAQADVTLGRPENGLEGRSKSTLEDYEGIHSQLIREIRKIRAAYDNVEAPVHPLDLAAHLVCRAPMLKGNSFRSYRAALVWRFGKDGSPDALDARDYLRQLNVDLSNTDEVLIGNKVRGRRGPGRKAKHITQSDLAELIEEVRQADSKYSTPTARWLACGKMTGLRPSEWKHAERKQIEGREALVVQNAKNSHNRAHGPDRTIFLDGLSREEMEILSLHLAQISEAGESGYEVLYEGCRKLLQRCAKRLWPDRRQRPALYTMRHQFVADAKSAGLSKEQIAALVGHASRLTAGTHYGKTMHGSGSVKVAPSDKDIEAVRRRNKALPKSREDAIPYPTLRPK